MNKKHISLAVLVLLIMFAQCLYFAWGTGQTIDETFYNGSGYPMVRYNDYQRLGEHPPLVMQLGSLPLLLLQPNYPYEDAVYLKDDHKVIGVDLSKTGSKFLYEKGNDPQLILFLERLSVIAITMLGGFFVFKWGYELFGFLSAFVALVLYAFSSNMIGHGSLFTTDMAISVFFFLCIYFSYRLFVSPSIRNASWVGIFAGLTLLSKMSGLILIPTLLSLFCIIPLIQPKFKSKVLTSKEAERLNKFLSFLSPVMFFCAITQKITGIALGSLCLVGADLTILSQYKDHKKMQVFIKWLLLAGWLVLGAFIVGVALKRPLPMLVGASLWCLTVFISSRRLSRLDPGGGLIDLTKIFLLIWFICAIVIMADFTDNFTSLERLNFFRHYIRSFNIATGHVFSGHQVCREGSFVTCDWKYFIASLLIKTPFAVIFLAAAGLVILLKSRGQALAKTHLIIPPLIFLIIASFLNKIYIGIRHVLVVYPFMFLLASVPMSHLAGAQSKFLKWGGSFVVSAMCLWVVVQNFTVAPHHLSYFNELVQTTEEGARLVADSSLNFGQDNKRLADLVKRLDIPKVKIAGIATNAAVYDYYGISWQYMEDKDFTRPAPGYYAIDSSAYVDLQKRADSWFRNKKPAYYAGKTFYVFKV